VLLACLSVHLLSFFLSGYVMRWLGTRGIEIVSRVFGLVLTSVAVNGIIVAIKVSFNLPP
jgi:multiple antibiotic resistance protein